MNEPVVRCQGCGQSLNEDPGLLPKPPCPTCGSTARAFGVTLGASIELHSKIAYKAKAGGKGRPFVEGVDGDDQHKATGRWNVLSRRIDRRRNRYRERIVDGETGEVIRDVDEPLTDHSGHGSAKPKD